MVSYHDGIPATVSSRGTGKGAVGALIGQKEKNGKGQEGKGRGREREGKGKEGK